MNKLVLCIEQIRAKLPILRKQALKETPTRTIILDPILEALGWDVRDPSEVQLEYPTIDNKSVDYALKINSKPALLVEAKPLDDPLNDVKGITQVVGYAANDGIVWCILANGVIWRVYNSMEKCPAPEKLMFEVNINATNPEEMPVTEIARQMWRFSREEVAKGTLDALGARAFTDGKVRKALDKLMRNPPRQLLNLIRTNMGGEDIAPQRIKESLSRIVAEILPGLSSTEPRFALPTEPNSPAPDQGKNETKPQTRRSNIAKTEYDESIHVDDKPQEVLELYRAIDRFCISLNPGVVDKRFRKKYVVFRNEQKSFCNIHLQRGGLRIWLPLKFSRLENPPAFVRDVTNVGHWGTGDLELDISSLAQVDQATPIIRQAFEGVA